VTNPRHRITQLEAEVRRLRAELAEARALAQQSALDHKLLDYRDSKWDPAWTLEIHGRKFKGTSYRNVLFQHLKADGLA
jgi:hypothetical protein